jgi:hypothetical protein
MPTSDTDRTALSWVRGHTYRQSIRADTNSMSYFFLLTYESGVFSVRGLHSVPASTTARPIEGEILLVRSAEYSRQGQVCRPLASMYDTPDILFTNGCDIVETA